MPKHHQQQQQHVDANAPVAVSTPSPRRSSTGRGVKELGMMMMLLTAESTLLASRMSAVTDTSIISPAAATGACSAATGVLSAVGPCVAAAAAASACPSKQKGSGGSSGSGSSVHTPSAASNSASSNNSDGDGENEDSGSSTPSSQGAIAAVADQQHIAAARQVAPSKKLSTTSLSSLDSDEQRSGEQQQQQDFATLIGDYCYSSFTAAELPDAVVGAIFSFLPWRDAARSGRGVSRQWNAACVLYNCTFYMMPTTGTGSVFVYAQPEQQMIFNDVHREAHIEAIQYQHRTADGHKWSCEACGYLNGETRVLCGSRNCQQPHPSHRNTARLFVGQLRREGTVPYVRWLLEDVVGSDEHPIKIKTIENHRDAQTHRGKGCCWVYLDDYSMAAPAAAVHRRVFADVDAYTGREGVWIVPEHCRDGLAREVQGVAYAQDRSLLLPRGALVVERPVMTPGLAVASSVAPPSAPRYTAAQQQQQQQQAAVAAFVPAQDAAAQAAASAAAPQARPRVHNPYKKSNALATAFAGDATSATTASGNSEPQPVSTGYYYSPQPAEAVAAAPLMPQPRSRGGYHQQQRPPMYSNGTSGYQHRQRTAGGRYSQQQPPAYFSASTPAYYQ